MNEKLRRDPEYIVIWTDLNRNYMSNSIAHVHTSRSGGISDYVDMLMSQNLGESRLSIRESDSTIPIPQECLLHYSGYGFSKRGAPLWMLKKIERERARVQNLGVFFHELYAFGPPWGSAFWLSPVQRHIARGLAEISNYWVTNREGSATWLRRFAGNKPHAVIPVSSNVGEMSSYSSVRVPKIVVFGSAALRIETYRAAGEDLFSWARARCYEVHDIGSAIEDRKISQDLRHAGVVLHGRLGFPEVSAQLANASLGLLAYPADYVAKSGVYAAYCAHGTSPVLLTKNIAQNDGLYAGLHYFDGLPTGTLTTDKVQNIGTAAWDWYQAHRIDVHIETIRRLSSESGLRC